MKFKALNAAALTAGALVPDIEPIIYIFLGLYPDRLVMHSIVGALSIDVALALLFLKLLSFLKLEKLGINGLANLKVLSKWVILSATVGSLSHVLVDSLHHNHNPLFWPLEPVYFTGPLVVAIGNPLATNIMSVVAITLIFIIVKILLKRRGHGISLFFTHPVKAVFILTNASRD